MAWRELKPFNQTLAGKVKGECEKNVREGFSIPSKYLCAWSDWTHTDQHTTPIPTGVDIPVFFWYKDINDGHVGVRLANGKFWSDGVTYDSIQAYEANHAPLYRGWSTKVDGVSVIQYVADPVPSAGHINLPVDSGAWHFYKQGGPYSSSNPANYVAVVHPALYPPNGLTYPIVAKLANGVYRINSPSHGVCDLFTNGSKFVIK